MASSYPMEAIILTTAALAKSSSLIWASRNPAGQSLIFSSWTTLILQPEMNPSCWPAEPTLLIHSVELPASVATNDLPISTGQVLCDWMTT